jgi:hypothetical protein
MTSFMDRYHHSKPGRAEIMSLIRMSDDGDQWGNAMGFAFGICDVLWHAEDGTVDIPAQWQYRHSPVCREVDMDQWPDSELQEMLTDGLVSTDDLLYAGTVVDRYARWLDAAGKSY